MHDREFEKQVHQKMQDLRLSPNPEVWARVQAGIQKKKRRRPVIIWFLLAGLLLGGAGLWYAGGWSEKKQKNSVAHGSVQPENNVIEKNEEKNPVDRSAGNIVKNNITTNPQQELHNRQTAQKQIAVVNAPVEKAIYESVKSPIQKKTKRSTQKETESTKQKEAVTNPQKESVTIKEESTPASKEEITNKQTEQPAPTQEQLVRAPLQQDSANKQAGIAMNNKPAKQNKNKGWQFGVNAGAGISDVGMQLFRRTSVADFAFTNSVSPTGGYNIRRPSEISPGAAFQFGGFISKGITKKLGIKLGLNHEYYSNSIKVGTLTNAPRVINQGPTMKMVDEYYTAGNDTKYTNKFHFISLPVILQWKLADRSKFGLVWENGVSLSRLISATALHFDGISGTYYKDNSLFNKTQFAASSSLLFSMKSKNLQFYAGPHLQYGISSLVDNSSSNNHLRYAGIKFIAAYNKK